MLVMGGLATIVASLAVIAASSATGAAVALAAAGFGLVVPIAVWLDGYEPPPEYPELIDTLTGLRNHRAFQEDLARELRRQSRSGESLALVILDVDALREVKARLGHHGGDEQLKAVASSLMATTRGGDAVYRLGSGEFAVILPGEKSWGGLRFVQRLEAGVELTAGIAEADGPMERDALIKHADLALGQAKRSGRPVVGYSPAMEVCSADPAPDQHHLDRLATALAKAVDAKDSSAHSHTQTVSEICAAIAFELGLEPERIEKLRLAGLLHDVGKIGISDAILRKPAALTSEEFQLMKAHTKLGCDIVRGAELVEEASWILYHHERLDGLGYPHGLHGEEIPLESRVILVADAFEAMTSGRPYRGGSTESEAFDELERNAGTQFDGRCVAALRRALAGKPRVGRARAAA